MNVSKLTLSGSIALALFLQGTATAQDDVSSALEEARKALQAAGAEINAAGVEVGGAVQVDGEGVRVGDGVEVDAGGVRVGDGIEVSSTGVRVEGTGATAGTSSGRVFRLGDFKNQDYRDADFSGATFTNYDFEDSDFSNADFSHATFSNVDFENVNLTGACFYGARLSNTDFDENTILDGTNMTSTTRSLTDFHANISKVVFEGEPCGKQRQAAVSGGVQTRASLINANEIIAALSVGKDATIDLTVNFANDSDQVRGEARAQVLQIANALTNDAMQGGRVMIEGHTDANGDDDYNSDLSYRRAIAVMRMLSEEYGIESGRLSVKGFGEQAPVASNVTAEGRALNRRVTLRNISG